MNTTKENTLWRLKYKVLFIFNNEINTTEELILLFFNLTKFLAQNDLQ